MKKLLISILVAAVLCVISILSYHQLYYLKVGIVDSNRLMAEYEGTKLALGEFEAKSKILKANLDTLTAEFQESIKKYEKDRVSMTENEILLSQEILQNKQNQLNQYQQVIEKKIQEEDQKVSQSLYTKVNTVVTEYGKEKGYRFILGAKGDGGVLFAEEAIDITDELIKVLNEGK